MGYDVNGNPVGYGMLPDQPFPSETVINLNINQTGFTPINFNMSSVPGSAVSFDGEVGMGRMGAASFAPFWEIVYAPILASVTTHVIPGYGDLFRYEAWVNMPDSEYHFSKNSPTLGDQDIDWGTFPAIPSNLAITNPRTERPTLSWNGSDPNADYVMLWIPYDDLDHASSYRYSIEAPTTRASIVFPELPGTLAQFRPTWIDYFEAGNIETDMANGYDDSLVKYGQYIGGTITEYTMKSSWKYYPR